MLLCLRQKVGNWFQFYLKEYLLTELVWKSVCVMASIIQIYFVYVSIKKNKELFINLLETYKHIDTYFR